MSPFAVHSICDACWERLWPGREPTRLELDHDDAESDDYHAQCCYCGYWHVSSIYVRELVGRAPQCSCEVVRLRLEVETLQTLLRYIEDFCDECPSCRRSNSHAAWCRLATAIEPVAKKTEGDPQG